MQGPDEEGRMSSAASLPPQGRSGAAARAERISFPTMAFVWKKTIDSKSEEITAAILTAEEEKEEER